MAEIIIMPKLGFNMDEGKLVRWCFAPGEPVKKGEILFEIETDKTTMSIEATLDGVLLKTMLDEGEFVPVFTPIAIIGKEGEDADAVLAAGSAVEAVTVEKANKAEETVAIKKLAEFDKTSLLLTPKAKKLIKYEGIDPASLAGIKGTGFQCGITDWDIKASPIARKLAEQSGIDLSAVSGSGVGSKIMKADVEAAAQYTSANKGAGSKQVLCVVPYKGTRKIIGDRLSQSMFTAPHLYFTDYIDTTELISFRRQLNDKSDVKIAVSDLLILTASKALQKYPGVNVSLVDGQIITYKNVNIGLAVAGDNGLIVPVVKNVQEKSLTVVAKETQDFVERAKAGRLLPEEYSDGTFTISNLGMFGIENFTAIINPPESAILAVSSVHKKAVVVTDKDGEDAVVIRPIMNVQLSVDHRVIDGLLAAQFVACFKELLENPLRILM